MTRCIPKGCATAAVLYLSEASSVPLCMQRLLVIALGAALEDEDAAWWVYVDTPESPGAPVMISSIFERGLEEVWVGVGASISMG